MGRLRCVIEPGPVISGDLARQMAHAWHGFAGLAVWWVLLAALERARLILEFLKGAR